MPGLSRFRVAQDGGVYEAALAELRAGRKQGHWMWFVFPQIEGLGRSEMARRYSIANRSEAASYLEDPVLGPRLNQCTDAMLAWAGRRSAEAILGPIDAMKFRSSMTLFEAAAPAAALFSKALDAFFAGRRDEATIERL